jgi:hypothetical protein
LHKKKKKGSGGALQNTQTPLFLAARPWRTPPAVGQGSKEPARGGRGALGVSSATSFFS